MDILFRPWREADAAACAVLADDEGVAANLRDVFPHPYTEQDARDFIALCLAADPEEALFCAVAVDGAFAGSVSLTRGADVACKSAELGYWFGRPFWGKGVATEAVRQMCARGFGEWDIVRIFAEPFSHNCASCRVLEKNGFTHEGTKRLSVYKRGKLLDSEMYALVYEGSG